jgi:chromosome segregation ATPase
MKPLIAILILACAALGAGLFYRHSTAQKESKQSGETITQLSTKVEVTERKLAEQSAVNQVLEKDIAARTHQLAETSNTLVTVTDTLAKVREEAQTAAASAAANLEQRDKRINELESQRDDLTKRMTDLNSQINGLDVSINDMNRKLAASEGDREFLLKELKRLQTEKNELERQFNDMAMLREQVRKLRDELSITRRLDWIRRGLYGSLKGAERLQRGFEEETAAATNGDFDLNVELKQSGGVNVVPGDTNAPANPPAEPPQPQ